MWRFAIVNRKLAEIYFEREGGKTVVIGYALIKRSEFKTLRELRQIESDIKKFRFTYSSGKYTNLITGEIFSCESKENGPEKSETRLEGNIYAKVRADHCESARDAKVRGF